MITTHGHDVPAVAMDSLNEQPAGALPAVRSLEPTPAEPDARPSESDPESHGDPSLFSPEMRSRLENRRDNVDAMRAGLAQRRLPMRTAPLFPDAGVPASSLGPQGFATMRGCYRPMLNNQNQRELFKARVGFEYFFSNYLLKLDFISECGEGGTDLTPASQLALEQAVQIVIALREAMSVMFEANLMARAEEADPFFQVAPIPQWGVVEPDTVVVENEISVAEYVHRLYRLHPGIGLHPVLSELTTMFSIGISAEPEHKGKHLLIVPPQMELMNALCNGDLQISWPS
jgi:hypothetical protein